MSKQYINVKYFLFYKMTDIYRQRSSHKYRLGFLVKHFLIRHIYSLIVTIMHRNEYIECLFRARHESAQGLLYK